MVIRKKSYLIGIIVVILIFTSSIVIAQTLKANAYAPSAPSALSYMEVTGNQATLRWQSVSGATGYKIYRTLANNSNYTLVSTVSRNSYIDTGLSLSTKYWYLVRAYNSHGESADSAHISLTTTNTPSATPASTSSGTPASVTDTQNDGGVTKTGTNSSTNEGSSVTTGGSPSAASGNTAVASSDTQKSANSSTATAASTTVAGGSTSGSGTSAPASGVVAPTVSPITSNTGKKLVLGYATYYSAGDTSSYNSMLANGSTLDEIATNTYVINGSGSISGLIPSNQINYANSRNIKSLVMIANNFDGSIAKTLLESSSNRQTLENNIFNAIKANGYKGVNIDLEGLYYYDRNYLTTFMSELYAKLHPAGYYVTIAVPAKTSDNPTSAWNGAYDYAALAQYTDQIVLMTYDEHYPGGTPGSNSFYRLG